MEIAAERLTGIAFLVIGLSHLLRPHGWVEFFARLRGLGAPGAFINGMMSLNFGAMIVAFHGTQWSGWPMLVTIMGWGQVLKGAIHLCFPAYSLRSMALVSPEHANRLVWAGGLMIPVACAIIIVSLR